MKDKTVQKIIANEDKRLMSMINLIASENFVSDDVRLALSSSLTNKYSEGYPGRRYYPGNVYVDDVERLAQDRALKLFGLNPAEWAVNVQCYSGSPANLAVYLALIGPHASMNGNADILGMALTSGGHLTHGHKVSATGQFWNVAQYTTAPNGYLDYDEIEKLARKVRPKVIVSGFTAYPRTIDFERFGMIAGKVGSCHMADISHIAGLVAAGLHPSPFDYADVVTTTTHKTLRGPRGAVIFSSKSKVLSPKLPLSEAVDKAVFPGLQGGPHNNVTAAKAVAFYEALQPSFKKYQAQIVKNARVLAEELKHYGFYLVTGGTDNHLMLVDFKKSAEPLNELDGAVAEKRLEEVGIIANRNTVPGDASAFKPSGLRIGTPAVTTKGFKEKEMKQIAKLMHECLTTDKIAAIKKEVQSLCRK